MYGRIARVDVDVVTMSLDCRHEEKQLGTLSHARNACFMSRQTDTANFMNRLNINGLDTLKAYCSYVVLQIEFGNGREVELPAIVRTPRRRAPDETSKVMCIHS